ncbi:MAG: carboxypeptidase-like regulatory domain-containing protein [Kineosporiaceae bacterium]
MRLDVTPQRVPLPPGQTATVRLSVTNTTGVISGYAVRVLGADPAWVEVDDPQPRLFPDQTAVVTVVLKPPRGLPAGPRQIGVQVRELVGERRCEVVDVVLDVVPEQRLAVRLDPRMVTGGRRATFSAIVENAGNTTVRGGVGGWDPQARLAFDWTPAAFSLDPGGQVVLALRASARRRLVGSPVPQQFELRLGGPAAPGATRPARSRPPRRRGWGPRRRPTVTPTPPAGPPDAVGVFVQRPVVGRGALSMIGLLTAATVFAAVITTALTGLASKSAEDRDLALAVAQARDAKVASGRSSLAGQVRVLSSGKGAARVSLEVFDATDPTVALASVSTDEAGAFAVGSLPAGSYKLRVRGEGLGEAWYPAASTVADAEAVDVADGSAVKDLTVLVGGVPARIAGTVVADGSSAAGAAGGQAAGASAAADVSGTIVRLELPLDVAPLAGTVRAQPGEAPPTGSGGAVVRTVAVAADGAFDLTDVLSPAVYDLVVEKPGRGTQVQRVDVAAGEDRTGLRLRLRRGDGTISGTVRDARGPVGGATVVASSGTTTVRTTSTRAGDAAPFALPDLPTPATYAVTVSAPGYAPTSLTLTLAPGQALGDVQVVLAQGSGTLKGTVRVRGAGDAGGITVTATDGLGSRQTVTRSTATAADWALPGLRVPGSYTVTLARPDLQTQVLSVRLDASGGLAAGDTSVVMGSATAALSGLTCHLRVPAASPSTPSPAGSLATVGGVTVTLSSGTDTWTVVSSTAGTVAGPAPFPAPPAPSRCPRGAPGVGYYLVQGLPPGTYTATFSLDGLRSTSTVLTLRAGDDRGLDVRLDNAATVEVTVAEPAGGAAAGHVVELWAADRFGSGDPPLASTADPVDGVYRFTGVSPGVYLVVVRDRPGGPARASSPVFPVRSSDVTVKRTVTLVG